MINILKYNDAEGKKLIEGLLSRSQLEYGDVQEKVNAIIADIKAMVTRLYLNTLRNLISLM